MPLETEIKFTVGDKTLFARIAGLGSIAGYTAVDRGIRAHSDRYFDTRDFKLYYGETVLRLRRSAESSVLTLKAHAPSEEGLWRRMEISEPTVLSADDIAAGLAADLPPCTALFDRFGKVELMQSLSAGNNRRVIELVRGDEALYELVLDDVSFSGPGGCAEVLELEVEALAGEAGNLFDIGIRLRESFGLSDAGPSKYRLGMELVGGFGRI